MSEVTNDSGPILQLLANGLSLWIRRQCDEVGDLNLKLNGSALQLLRGKLKGVELEGRLVTFQGLPIHQAEVSSGPLNLNLKPQAPTQILQLQDAFALQGNVTMRGVDLNRALLTDRWRWLGDWLAEQLMGLNTLGSLEIDNDLLILSAPVLNAREIVKKQFRLDAAQGTIRISRVDAEGEVLLSTGNKSELAVGYCTLYGDMNGGLAVIGDLYKSTVFALSAWLDSPASTRCRQDLHLPLEGELVGRAIRNKPPSAELRPDQKDSDSLPDYAVLDPLLKDLIEHRCGRDELLQRGHPADAVDQVQRLFRRSEFKRRQAAPVLKVSPQAFGSGWRLPIAAG